MKYSILTLIFVLAALLSSCSDNPSGSNVNDITLQFQGDNYTFITSQAMYKELQENNSDELSEEFTILDVNRIDIDGGLFLEIEIEHQICEPDKKIIWNGDVADSHPPQVFLFLKLLPEGTCTEGENVGRKNEILLLDIDDFIKDEYTAKNAIFSVTNASTKETVNGDEPVSSG